MKWFKFTTVVGLFVSAFFADTVITSNAVETVDSVHNTPETLVTFTLPEHVGNPSYGQNTASSTTSEFHYLACTVNFRFPRSVQINAGVDREIVLLAMAEWNSHYGHVFVEATPEAVPDITVIKDTTTWVTMPCSGVTQSIVHIGPELGPGYLSYWLAHEFGHTIGFADHIYTNQSDAGYIDPGRCGDGYEGIMSYCTLRPQWFGRGDLEMMFRTFPQLFHRIFISAVGNE